MLALSIVIIFRSTDTVNFAIGDIGTSGLFVAGTLITVEQPVALGLLIHAGIFVGWGTCPRPFPALVGGTVTVFGIALAWNTRVRQFAAPPRIFLIEINASSLAF